MEVGKKDAVGVFSDGVEVGMRDAVGVAALLVEEAVGEKDTVGAGEL